MKRIGKQTLELERDCFIVGRGYLSGQKEKDGNYGAYIKNVVDDDKMNEKTFEKGERKMLSVINENAIKDAKLKLNDIDIYSMRPDYSKKYPLLERELEKYTIYQEYINYKLPEYWYIETFNCPQRRVEAPYITIHFK